MMQLDDFEKKFGFHSFSCHCGTGQSAKENSNKLKVVMIRLLPTWGRCGIPPWMASSSSITLTVGIPEDLLESPSVKSPAISLCGSSFCHQMAWGAFREMTQGSLLDLKSWVKNGTNLIECWKWLHDQTSCVKMSKQTWELKSASSLQLFS